ncbi:hypothetical protein LCGC14_2256850 [marine sediment metagenome]|uniref:Tyr recombinase domain-containing protein n=1 Tax=marine sediment metagenome TaxID=412755 RepID=A0A0F9FVZ5_9ZZZZ
MGRKIPETIIEVELLDILKATNNNNDRLAFALGFYEAMRISEITSLKPENIDSGQRLIRIKQAKGSKDRNIPIAPEVMKALKYLPIKTGIRALQIAFKKKAKEVLGKDLHFHCLRHSGASHYINKKNWDLRSLQVFLGHSKIETTEIYVHVSPENLIDKMWG